MRGAATLLVAVMTAVAVAAAGSANGHRFFSDDPLTHEPETQDASRVREWEIDLFVDLAINLFALPGDDRTGVHARNVNSIDEVPDSSWFTNRIGARPVSIEEATRGPSGDRGVAPGPWTIVAAKQSGFAPGFTIEDAAGETWFISFDARGYPEAATGAIVVATKIFWTLGYWQADNVLTSIRAEDVSIADSATIKTPSGRRRKMNRNDVNAVWARSHRSADGSYRAVASRRLPGRPLGGFRYCGTRPDDPNDIVPHEHRRELRALKVFGAWTNLVDMKAGNTLDMLVTTGGQARVRHYLHDVGSTFGTGANAPREYFEGWEHVYEHERTWKRLISFGFFLQPWQTIQYDESPAIGRFEGDRFDPAAWKPRVPTAALRHAQPDDLFWAARRVMAFSDDMIRGIAASAGFADPADARRLASVLIERRDKIGAAYLMAVAPFVDFQLEAGRLAFTNAAAQLHLGPSRVRYEIGWAYFDNASGSTTAIGGPKETTTERVEAPVLREATGTFVRVRVRAVEPIRPDWRPVDAYFRRTDSRWVLVGIDRAPAR